MICGSASGVLLPPYVIYKSERLYNTWVENGPRGQPCCDGPCCSRGARYNRTSHGWIDMDTFRDWFETIFLPHAKRLPGKKLLLGDNLSSHFSPDVLQLCNENNILFVCLPPNSTNICQPLDVAFFRPMKQAWRKTLTVWKLRNKGQTGLPKPQFPQLLRETLEKMDSVHQKNDEVCQSAIKRNLQAGFRATGVYPLDAGKVLSKLPYSIDPNMEENINNSLTEFLKEQRYKEYTTPRRNRQMKVIPGRSITCLGQSDESEDEEEIPSSRASSEDVDDDGEDDNPVYINPSNQCVASGNFVLAKFKGGSRKKTEFRFVCVVQEVEGDEVKVLGMRSMGESRKVFRTEDNDISNVSSNDIIAVLPQPNLEGSGARLRYIFPTNIDVKEM